MDELTTKKILAAEEIESPMQTYMPFSRRILHVFLILFGWGLYAYYCWKVANTPGVTPTFHLILWFSLTFIIITPLLTFFWIVHNKNIARKRAGRRKEIPPLKEVYEYDWEGRKIHADWEKLRKAPEIKVIIEKDKKTFVVDHPDKNGDKNG